MPLKFLTLKKMPNKRSFFMRSNVSAKTLLEVICAINFVAAPEKSLGAESETFKEEDTMNFHYGDSCDRLASLSDETVGKLTRLENTPNFKKFCEMQYDDCNSYGELFIN